MRRILATAVLGIAVLSSPARADDERVELPAVFANAKVGDWLAVSVRSHQDGKSPDVAPNFATVTVEKIEEGEVFVRVQWARMAPEKTTATFQQKDSPALADQVNLLAPVMHHPHDVKLERVKRAVAGKDGTACVKATFMTTRDDLRLEHTVWFSASAPPFGLVAWEAKRTDGPAFTRTCELVGFGTGSETTWGNTAAEARKAACDDDKPLPLNPYANAKEGDWCVVASPSPDGASTTYEIWTVSAINAPTVAVHIEATYGLSWNASRSTENAPTIREFLSYGASVDYYVTDMKVEDASLTISPGKTLACKKVTATLTQVNSMEDENGAVKPFENAATETIWLCAEVKASGVAFRRHVDHVLGYGSKDTTDWGRTWDQVQKLDAAWRSHFEAASKAAKRGDDQAVTKHVEAALAEVEKAGDDDDHIAPTLEMLANLAVGRRDAETAERLLRRSIALRESTPGPVHGAAAGPLVTLGRILDALRRFDEAEVLYSKAVELQEAEWGPNSTLLATALYQLAAHHYLSGKNAEAARNYERALEIFRAEQGDESPQAVRIVPELLAMYLSLYRYDEAEALARKTFDICKKRYDGSRACAQAQKALAAVLKARGKYAEAAAHYEKALETWDARRADMFVAGALEGLGEIRQALHETEKAERHYERALQILEGAFGKDDPRIARTIGRLASLEDELGRKEKSVSLYERAIAVQEKAWGKEAATLTVALGNLGALHCAQGRVADGAALIERALAIAEKSYGADAPETARCHALVGQLRIAEGSNEPAEAAFAKALAIFEKTIGPAHPELVPLLRRYGGVERKLAKTDEAEKLEARARAIAERDVR